MANLLALVYATDGTRIGRRWGLRADAGVERICLSAGAAFIGSQLDRGRGTRAVLRHRRGAVELHDGDIHHLFAAADRDLFRAAPLYGVGTDAGRYQRLTTT